MRLSSNLKAMIEDDVKKLMEAFCTGKILAGGNSLITLFDEGQLNSLAASKKGVHNKGEACREG